jgi:hypothetical protein
MFDDNKRGSNVEWIPANPPVNSAAVDRIRQANNFSTVRDRQVEHVIIPPPPVAERVEVPKPAERRRFVDPGAAASRRTRRD